MSSHKTCVKRVRELATLAATVDHAEGAAPLKTLWRKIIAGARLGHQCVAYRCGTEESVTGKALLAGENAGFSVSLVRTEENVKLCRLVIVSWGDDAKSTPLVVVARKLATLHRNLKSDFHELAKALKGTWSAIIAAASHGYETTFIRTGDDESTSSKCLAQAGAIGFTVTHQRTQPGVEKCELYLMSWAE